MQEMQIFNNTEFGQVRTITINGDPWFVGNDCAKALGYVKPKGAIQNHVDSDDKQMAPIQDPRGNIGMMVINESGLYSLIFGSKLETAKEFKHWVTSEVLPQIRKTGCYQNESLPKKINQDIPVGELARLSAVMDRIMVRQQSEPHDIANSFKMLCGQFGIVLPDNFVNVPKYKQMELQFVGTGQDDGGAQ